MSDLDDVVARVRDELATDDAIGAELDWNDVDHIRTILAAYESAVRERDEARSDAAESLGMYHRCREKRDHARAALRRVRGQIGGMKREHHAKCVELGASRPSWLCDLLCVAGEHNAALDAVVELLDREAPDA